MWPTGSGSPPPFFGKEAHPAKPSWLRRLWNNLFHVNELYRRRRKKKKTYEQKDDDEEEEFVPVPG
jgi:hypothetical protein